MSVIEFSREKGYPKTEGTLSPDGTITQTHSDLYNIVTDDDNDEGDIILAQLPISYGDMLASSFLIPCFLTSLRLDRNVQHRRKWQLAAKYTPLTPEDQENQNTPPDLRTPEWSWTFESWEHIVRKDVDGLAIVNAVGEPIELTAQQAFPILTVERNQLTFDPDTILEYANHVNSTEFYGADPKTVLMRGIEDRKDTQRIWQNIYYRRVRYTTVFALPFIPDVLEGWTDLVLNRGTFYIDNDARKVHFRTDDGAQITGNLDLAGQKLDEGLPPIVLKFNTKKEANFNTLNLGPF